MIHISELRDRFLYLLFSFILTFLIGYFKPFTLMYIVSRPLLLISDKSSNFNFIFTEIGEAFQVTIQSILLVSFFIWLPLLLYNIWSFLIPGCYHQERLKLNFYTISFLILFNSCIFNGYFFIIPLIWHFLLSFQIDLFPMSLIFQAKIKNYLEHIQFLLLPVSFFIGLLPLIYSNLIKSNIVKINKNNIKNIRKISIIISLLFASLISPPDIIYQSVFTLFFYFLVELFIFSFFIKNMFKKR
jgi:sec-independent protein translocase protein TatC